MGVAREHVHGFDFFAAHLEFHDLVGADLAFLNQGAAAHDDEEFPLAVVPMFALGDSRLGNVHAELAAIHCLQELGEAPACIHVHLEREAHLFPGQIAQVGGIQLLFETVVRDFGHHERLRLVVELVQQIHDCSELDFVDRGDVAIDCFVATLLAMTITGNNIDSVKCAVMFPACQGGNHFFHQVVDVEQFHVHIRVVHLDGQIVSDVVAEGRHGTVVVQTAPLAEKIRETVDQNARAGLAAVFKEQLLARFLAASVLAVAEAARQRGLNAAAEHHRASILVTFERFQKVACEPVITGHELAVVLGTVHASKVEHEIRLGASIIQLGQRRINVVLEDFADNEASTRAVLAIANVLERRNQVASHKALCTSNKNIHKKTSDLSNLWTKKQLLKWFQNFARLSPSENILHFFKFD